MTASSAFVVVLVVLFAMNVWVHVGRRRTHPITGPLAALALLFVGRTAGLSWVELGLGRDTFARGLLIGALAAGLVGAAYLVGVGLPVTRRFFVDTRYRLGPGSALYTAFIAVPLATVVFEEVAFRSVLWGLVLHDHGEGLATAVTAVLFGLWHVLPAKTLARTNTALQGGGRRRVLLTVLGTVAFTTFAGALFGLLRNWTGSLLAPMLLHWATNGLGVLASAWVWALSRR